MDEKQGVNLPIISIPHLQRDAYFLLALLLADEKIAQFDELLDTVEEHFEGSVNQLLIWLSTASRQMLELSKSDIKDNKCGKYWINLTSPPRELTFRQACSTIIHATEIVPYETKGNTSKQLGAAKQFYTGRLTIRGKNKKREQIIELDCPGSETCETVIMLSRIFSNGGTHADTQNHV